MKKLHCLLAAVAVSLMALAMPAAAQPEPDASRAYITAPTASIQDVSDVKTVAMATSPCMAFGLPQDVAGGKSNCVKADYAAGKGGAPAKPAKPVKKGGKKKVTAAGPGDDDGDGGGGGEQQSVRRVLT